MGAASGKGLRRVQWTEVSRCGECESKVRRNGRFDAEWESRLVRIEMEVQSRAEQYVEHEMRCGLARGTERGRAGQASLYTLVRHRSRTIEY